jgi:hypothetical protein
MSGGTGGMSGGDTSRMGAGGDISRLGAPTGHVRPRDAGGYGDSGGGYGDSGGYGHEGAGYGTQHATGRSFAVEFGHDTSYDASSFLMPHTMPGIYIYIYIYIYIIYIYIYIIYIYIYIYISLLKVHILSPIRTVAHSQSLPQLSFY